jgi:hypothetical protein
MASYETEKLLKETPHHSFRVFSSSTIASLQETPQDVHPMQFSIALASASAMVRQP